MNSSFDDDTQCITNAIAQDVSAVQHELAKAKYMLEGLYHHCRGQARVVGSLFE